jgi:2-oxoglutarate dehydrogenase E2 component (dihydrolipoamide succinyltransferase)
MQVTVTEPDKNVTEPAEPDVPEESVATEGSNIKITPVAHKMMEENHLSMEDVLNGLHRISKGDVEAVLASTSSATKSVGKSLAILAGGSPRRSSRCHRQRG